MKTPKFELNKLARLVRVQGVEYTFQRNILNDFKEPTGTASSTVIKGVFHQTTTHLTVIEGDAASVQTKPNPFILALYTDAKDVRQNDWVMINGRKYVVTGVNDICNWNIAIDICLEIVV